jgi:uncharacterized PurR-regulated membrane protein YhhQ (DUF165 family)
MDTSKHLAAQKLYLYLAALFITSLVVSNLIFQKFFYWYPFDWEIMGNSLFELSVGILPYPITFLVTDLISEIFGKKAANRVVIAGIFASFFSMGIQLLYLCLPVYRYLYRCWLVMCLWCVAMGRFPRSVNFWRCV